MQKKLLVQETSVVEALDALSSMAELDFQKVKKLKEDYRRGQAVIYPSKWLIINDDQKTLDNIKRTFEILLGYLKSVGEKDKEKIKLDETQKGIRAMIILLDEAAVKVDRYTSLMEKGVVERSVKELKEFQQLKELYHKKLLKKLQKTQDEKELWLAALEDEVASKAHIDERGVRDLQAVKEDQQYELFYIKREDGKRFFNQSLLRHVKLVHDFDKVVVSSFEEDPFLLIQKVKDKMSHQLAKEIKDKSHGILCDFFRKDPANQSLELYVKLSYAMYGLYLASSYHNLIEEGGRKSSLQYFSDFKQFLEQAVVSTDFNANKNLEKNQISPKEQMLADVLYNLCYDLFTSVGARDQMIGLIYRLMDQVGKGERGKREKAAQMWTDLSEASEHLYRVLDKFPNGPLFKLLDSIQEDTGFGFEPLMHNCLPTALFDFKSPHSKVKVLKIPSPTKQEGISEAKLSLLFEGFLRGLSHCAKKEKILIINLQDRTSWKDQARCHLLENLPMQAAFCDVLEVCTLAKDTSFYHQSEEYAQINDAQDFKKLLHMQVLGGPECGFFFPKSINHMNLEYFVKESIEDIHMLFFADNKVLTKKNRQDFIEIFYQALLTKLTEVIQPSHVAFVCKDGADVSATAAATFYGFLKLCSHEAAFSPEEEDFFVWMLHASALVQRERAVHKLRCERALEALGVVHAELEIHKQKKMNQFEKNFQKDSFKNLVVDETKPAI